MNETFYDEEHYFYMDFVLLTEEILIAVSAVLNVLVNILMMGCLFKVGLKSALNVGLFNLSLLDIIQLLSCPAMYKVFSKTHDVFEIYESYSIFTNIYYSAMVGVLICYGLLVLKGRIPFLEKRFKFFVPGIWVISVVKCIIGYIIFQKYYKYDLFLAVYIFFSVLLYITVTIEQLISTLNWGSEIVSDHKISMVLTLFFISLRICFIIILTVFSFFFKDYIYPHVVISLVNFNASGNVALMAYMDRKFRYALYNILRINHIAQNNNVNFVNLPEETVNILADE